MVTRFRSLHRDARGLHLRPSFVMVHNASFRIPHQASSSSTTRNTSEAPLSKSTCTTVLPSSLPSIWLTSAVSAKHSLCKCGATKGHGHLESRPSQILSRKRRRFGLVRSRLSGYHHQCDGYPLRFLQSCAKRQTQTLLLLLRSRELRETFVKCFSRRSRRKCLLLPNWIYVPNWIYG